MSDFKVGDFVYRGFRPQKPGKVLLDLGPEVLGRRDGTTFISSFHLYRVKWLDSGRTIEDVSARGLKNFRQLIEDHQRKLNTHLKALKLLEEIE